jgi:hypothetical protein
MTIFQLTRKRLIDLMALYLQTRPGYQRHQGSDVSERAAAVMTRDQLAAAIAATPEGARLLDGGAR